MILHLRFLNLHHLLPCSDASTQTQLPWCFSVRLRRPEKSSDKETPVHPRNMKKEASRQDAQRILSGKILKKKIEETFTKTKRIWILISYSTICILVYQHIEFLKAVRVPQSSTHQLSLQKSMGVSLEICKAARGRLFQLHTLAALTSIASQEGQSAPEMPNHDSHEWATFFHLLHTKNNIKFVH